MNLDEHGLKKHNHSVEVNHSQIDCFPSHQEPPSQNQTTLQWSPLEKASLRALSKILSKLLLPLHQALRSSMVLTSPRLGVAPHWICLLSVWLRLAPGFKPFSTQLALKTNSNFGGLLLLLLLCLVGSQSPIFRTSALKSSLASSIVVSRALGLFQRALRKSVGVRLYSWSFRQKLFQSNFYLKYLNYRTKFWAE